MTQTVVELGFIPRPWQAEVFENLMRFSVIVVHRQAGKTELAIVKLVHQALKTPDGRFGYVAPLLKQAKGIAWDRLKAYARKVPVTDINESELSVKLGVNGARIRLFGADNPDGLRGLVFNGLVLDEVAQLAPWLWGEVLLPTLAAKQGWAIFIGTSKGINLFSQIYYKALDDEGWYAARYDCHATKVFTPQEITAIAAEMTPAQFRQEMLCDFAATSDNVLIPLDVALAATKRHIEPALYRYAPKILGVDVAWDGGDRSVIMPRQGLVAFRPVVERGLPEKTFANRVAQAINTFRPDATFVDTTGGYGGEVVSRLRDSGHNVQNVVFSWKASDERYLNLRAEMWFKMSTWMQDGSIPSHPAELLSELCAPTYDNDNAANRLKLESKDDLKARIGCSPDIADALALTFAFPVATKPMAEAMRGQANKVRTMDSDVEA